MSDSASWWAAKIRGDQPPAPLPPIPTPKPPVAPPTAAVVRPQVPTATSAQARCPECGSGNYMGARGNMPRCFDCGYVPNRDFRNSTQGLTGGEGPVEKAPGQQTGTYNPSQVIGRVE